MNYNVGSKVRVRSDLVVGEKYGGLTFFEDMDDLRGKVLTVTHVNIAGNVSAIETPYFISSEMLEPTEETFNGAIEVLNKIKDVLDNAGLGQGADLDAYYKIRYIMRNGV